MRENLTQQKIDRAKNLNKDYELRDTNVRQLFYRVKASGVRSWIVKYTDPDTGKKRRKFTLDVPTNRLDDARKAAEKFFSELTAGGNPAKKNQMLIAKSLTLNEAIELYKPYTDRLRSAKDVMQELYKIAKWQNIGKKAINEITRIDLDKFIKDESKRVTKRTINKKITLLYGMMSKLYQEDLVKPEDVKLPRKPKKIPETDSNKNRRYFEIDERIRLVDTAKTMSPAWLFPAVVISLNTGMRPRSLFNLTWKDIDFKSSCIHLRARFMKTKDDWTIPMNKKTIEALQEWKKRTVFSNQDLIFSGKTEVVTKDEWSVAFDKLIKKAEIFGVTWYNMRHDFASQLVMKGVSLYTVKDLMCHKNITTTQVYAHLSPDLKSAAVSLLDDL